MAIFGKLTHLEWFFKANPVLANNIQTYMFNAINPAKNTYKRITNITLDAKEERKEMILDFTKGIRAIEQTYYLKSPKDAFYETHNAFIDLQLVVRGYECISIGDSDTFCIKTPYNAEKDIIIYENRLPQTQNTESSATLGDMPLERDSDTPVRTHILLESGDLAIFFPNDVHAGGLHTLDYTFDTKVKTKIQVHKTVIKMPIELLNI